MGLSGITVKGAVNRIIKRMAIVLAADNTYVNAICSIVGETQMLAAIDGGEVTPETRGMFLNTIRLGRLSEPLDFAEEALFLASDESSIITGVCMGVVSGR